MKFKDYYETFGVPRNATQDDIKRAQRKLARKYYPDVSKEGRDTLQGNRRGLPRAFSM